MRLPPLTFASACCWLVLAAAPGPYAQHGSGKPFLVDARGPTRDRKVAPKVLGGEIALLVDHAAQRPLQLDMKLSAHRIRLGGSVTATFTLTNRGKRPLTIPLSVNSADIEPPDPLAAGYKFWRLTLSVSLPGPVGLEGGAVLYGDPSVPGTTHVLEPGGSLVVLADVEAEPTNGPALGPGTASVHAFAYLERVTETPQKGGLSEHGAEVASASSPPCQIKLLPPN